MQQPTHTHTHKHIHHLKKSLQFSLHNFNKLRHSFIMLGLSSLKFFWWAPEFLLISASRAFPLFKGIQGHSRWCQSKAHMRLPISP